MASHVYVNQRDLRNNRIIEGLLKQMPPYVTQFTRAMQQDGMSSLTLVGYLRDLRHFLKYMSDQACCELKYYDLDMLGKLNQEDIREWSYETGTNVETSRRRNKLAMLKTFYNYLTRNEMIEKNPMIFIDLPKVNKKEVVIIKSEDIHAIFNSIYQSERSSSYQKRTTNRLTKYRDVAIITVLLGTGIRVSELVGIDLSDLDMHNNELQIVRKGGSEETIYFAEEVHDALSIYLKERHLLKPIDNALFVSMHHKRIAVRTVEELFVKYKEKAGLTNKVITPHRARASYGSNLYAETGDIYLTSSAMGHSSVETTKNYYARMPKEKLKEAAIKASTIFD